MRILPALVACVVAAVVGCGRDSAKIDPTTTFMAAVRITNQLTRNGTNPVPDAVLNRTRCIVIVPSFIRQAESWPAAMACRDGEVRWQQPQLLSFAPTQRPTGDALIFVLSDRAVSQLNENGLPLGRGASVRSGPLVQQVATVTDADLDVDALTYDQAQALWGKIVTGSLRREANTSASKSAERELQTAITSFFNTITPIGIIIHHSAVLPGDGSVPQDAKDVDTFHRERGFDIVCGGREYHVAYHYLVLPDGTVKAGRPENCEGAHARGYNQYLGIAVFGDFSSVDNPRGQKGEMKPTPKQMTALTELCRRLVARYHIPLHRVMRHSDVSRTQCPGDRFPFQAFLLGLQSTG